MLELFWDEGHWPQPEVIPGPELGPVPREHWLAEALAQNDVDQPSITDAIGHPGPHQFQLDLAADEFLPPWPQPEILPGFDRGSKEAGPR